MCAKCTEKTNYIKNSDIYRNCEKLDGTICPQRKYFCRVNRHEVLILVCCQLRYNFGRQTDKKDFKLLAVVTKTTFLWYKISNSKGKTDSYKQSEEMI